MSQEHVDAVRRSLDGWNRDDFDACVSIAHPEIEWTSELAQRIHGPKTVYRGIAGLRRYWDGFEQLMGYVYEFEDGMARRVRSYHDPDRALEAVGLPR